MELLEINSDAGSFSIRNDSTRSFVALLLCLFFLALPQPSQAQKPWEEERKEILADAVAVLMQGDETKGEAMLVEVERIAWEHNDSVLVLRCINGQMNIHMDEVLVLDSLLQRARPFLQTVGEFKDSTLYYVMQANLYNLRGDYKSQILYVDSSLTLAEQANDSLKMSFAYVEQGAAYSNIGNFAASRDAYIKADAHLTGPDTEYYASYINRSIGWCYLEMGQSDSALYHLEAAVEGFAQTDFVLEGYYAEAMIGKCYLEAGNLLLAGKYLEKSTNALFQEGLEEGETAGFNNALGWLAEYYREVGANEKARTAALMYFELADAQGQMIHRPEALETLLNIVLVDQPQIQSYFQMYVGDQKQLYEEQNSRAVLEYERKYKAEEAEKKVLVLDRAAKEAELRAQQNRFYIFLVLSLALFAGLVVALFTLRARFRARQQINELNRKALQLQINPHFFFNVLNSINHYILENDQKSASFYLARFAKLMRLSLDNSQFDKVEVGQEMDLVEAYLQLEKLRNDSFDLEIQCPEELRELKIPPLMVQPFVENSVVHAFPEGMPHRGKIWINARVEAGLLNLDICDNGVGIQEGSEKAGTEGKTSLAIKILTERLRAYGKQKGEILFGPADPDQQTFPGTRVRVRIPLA